MMAVPSTEPATTRAASPRRRLIWRRASLRVMGPRRASQAVTARAAPPRPTRTGVSSAYTAQPPTDASGRRSSPIRWPSRMRTTRPAVAPMAGSWVTSTIVWPSWRFSSWSSATTWSAMAVSRLPVGSSAQTIAGRAARARAMVTRCCSPPDSSLGRWPVRWPSPTRSSMRTAAALARRAGTPLSSSGSSTFSAAVNTGMRLKAWKTKPMEVARWAVRLASERANRSWPATSTRPPSMSSSPDRQFNRVVLPEPLGPMTATSSPRRTFRSSPARASTSMPPVRYTLRTRSATSRGVSWPFWSTWGSSSSGSSRGASLRPGRSRHHPGCPRKIPELAPGRAQGSPWDLPSRRSAGAAVGQLGPGQAQLEAGPLSGRGGVGEQQRSALGVGQLAGDVQAETDPAGQPGRPRVELGEALEDALALGRRDPGAAVPHGPGGQGGGGAGLGPERCRVGGGLGRVVEQVSQDLGDGLRDGPDGQDLRGAPEDLARRVGGPGRAQGVAGHGGGVDHRPLPLLVGAALHPGGQQQLLDLELEPVPLARGHADQLLALGVPHLGLP